jgi:hypothetical protein
MSTTTALKADEDREPVYQKEYQSIRLPLVLDGTEVGHPVFCVSVRLFSGVAEDFTSAGCQADLQVSLIHS